MVQLVEKTCPICGKIYYPAPGHVYKYKSRLVCSWSCVRTGEKKNGQT